MGLVLIGMGLFDEKDLTLRGMDEAKQADKVYIELYTSKWHGSIEELEKIIGKKVVEVKRKDLEENSSTIVNEAKTQNIAIFIQGDPLVATVHNSLLLEARKLGIETKIIHNASILSAVAETGLHIYRFGPTVTVPFSEKTKGKLPQSVYKIIKENKKRNLHTLCLLDVVSEEIRYMKVNEGLDILLKGKVVTQGTKIVVFGKAGSDNPLIICDKVENITEKDIQNIPIVIIIPGELHFTESEYLNICYTGKK